MSTDSGSTAAGDPRRRQAEDLPSHDTADTAGNAPNEPDVTRRLDTTSGRESTRSSETETLDTSVTGTRDPNDAAYRTEHSSAPDGSGHPQSRREHNNTEHRTDTEAVMPNREARLAAERERFGGIKFGAAFFGWLTATGMVVLLSALAAAIGTAVGVSTDSDLGAALDQAAANQSAGLAGAIISLIVLLLAYYAGGYVAGRMARFNGAKQGVAVWLWALIAAAVVIILGLIFNDDIRSVTQLNSVAPLPQDLSSVGAGAWLALLATVVVSLIGAVLGGLAGMRFHRRVDRAKFSPAPA
ncbi:MAG: TIGR04086 family membrane protein [Arthrobacter sp.]